MGEGWADCIVTFESVRVAVGPGNRGRFREQGNQVREIAAGDIVMIPAGVFHGWRDIADHLTYLSIRPDPDRVLPGGLRQSGCHTVAAGPQSSRSNR